MGTRAAFVVLAGMATLAGCSRQAEAPKVAEGSEHVDCALGVGARFAPDCAVERSTVGAQQILVVRHPDGAFRRFTVRADGVATADGAEKAVVAAAGNVLDVRVGTDRYRIPYTVKPGAPQ